jgi:lipoprotein-anchoring transpeptidase ErfK/SrfK
MAFREGLAMGRPCTGCIVDSELRWSSASKFCVGSEEKPTPSGSFKVISSDANPTYRYNPQYKFKGVKSKKPFTIRPGPNNPVGSYWIGLSAEGYGLHGTPNPSKISKAESHGCVRLSNWDAVLLGTNVEKGTPVMFVDQPLAKE